MHRLLILVLCSLVITSCTPFKVPQSSPYFNSHRYDYNHTLISHKYIQARRPSKSLKISNLKFETLSENRGLWTGIIEGDGKYNLRLNFYHQRHLLKSKNISTQILSSAEGPVWFKFQSSLPIIKTYTWKIEGYQQ